jgi:hypothetical protein
MTANESVWPGMSKIMDNGQRSDLICGVPSPNRRSVNSETIGASNWLNV